CRSTAGARRAPLASGAHTALLASSGAVCIFQGRVYGSRARSTLCPGRQKPQTPPRTWPRGRLGFVFHNRSGGSDGVDTCHLLDGLDGEGQGAAAGGATHDAGVVVLEEAARHVTGDIQAGDGLVAVVLGLAVGGDGNALQAAQQAGAQPAAVEGRGPDGAQAAGRLAEVHVL